MKPIRIQLSRKKGWRMPSNTVNVARPSKWGNPWAIGKVGPDGEMFSTPERVVERFRQDVRFNSDFKDLSELRGKNLACWCPLDQSCHADVLLELANKEP